MTTGDYKLVYILTDYPTPIGKDTNPARAFYADLPIRAEVSKLQFKGRSDLLVHTKDLPRSTTISTPVYLRSKEEIIWPCWVNWESSSANYQIKVYRIGPFLKVRAVESPGLYMRSGQFDKAPSVIIQNGSPVIAAYGTGVSHTPWETETNKLLYLHAQDKENNWKAIGFEPTHCLKYATVKANLPQEEAKWEDSLPQNYTLHAKLFTGTHESMRFLYATRVVEYWGAGHQIAIDSIEESQFSNIKSDEGPVWQHHHVGTLLDVGKPIVYLFTHDYTHPTITKHRLYFLGIEGDQIVGSYINLTDRGAIDSATTDIRAKQISPITGSPKMRDLKAFEYKPVQDEPLSLVLLTWETDDGDGDNFCRGIVAELATDGSFPIYQTRWFNVTMDTQTFSGTAQERESYRLHSVIVPKEYVGPQ